jgi:hypothetical protein
VRCCRKTCLHQGFRTNSNSGYAQLPNEGSRLKRQASSHSQITKGHEGAERPVIQSRTRDNGMRDKQQNFKLKTFQGLNLTQGDTSAATPDPSQQLFGQGYLRGPQSRASPRVSIHQRIPLECLVSPPRFSPSDICCPIGCFGAKTPTQHPTASQAPHRLQADTKYTTYI